jgi:hypothetical protein
MDYRKWPQLGADLIDHLEKAFPEKSPQKGETLENLMFRGGQRDVVSTLRAVFTQQNETVLNVLEDESVGRSSGDDR